jgi:hypothetical protein
MTDYGVMHRCRWAVWRNYQWAQCTRRGRWVRLEFWFCLPHWRAVFNLPDNEARGKVYTEAGVQLRILP